MTNQNFDSKTLVSTWRPFINEAAGNAEATTLSPSRELFVAMLASNKQYLMEGASAVGMASNTAQGVGAITLPAQPGTYGDFFDPTKQLGSGDAIAMLGMSMTIAAQTIAFDLLPTVPVYAELITLDYLDVVYTGGRFDSAVKPQIFSIRNAELAALSLSAGDVVTLFTNPSGSALRVKFLQRQKTTANTVVVQYVGTAASFDPAAPGTFAINEALTLTSMRAGLNRFIVGVTGTPSVTTVSAGTIEFDWTSALSDHTNVGSNDGNLDGTPMDRTASEGGMGTANVAEIRTYQKAIQTRSYEQHAYVTRQQARSLKARGIDALPIVKTALANMVTQSINKDVLTQMRKLGVANHYGLLNAQGANFNLYCGPGGTTSKAFTAFSVPAFIDNRGVNRNSAFGNITNSETNSSAENRLTRAAAISGRILAAAHAIGATSKFGAGDFAVVGPQIAAALKNAKALQTIQYEGSISGQAASLYFIGDCAGVKIYSDPNMTWNDNTIIVGRSNKSASGLDYQNLNQGLVFCAYDLAATVEVINETTMSPHVMIESLYALAATGVQPELAYLTFGVHTDFGAWI